MKNLFNKITTIILAVLIATFSVAFIIIPDKEFSEKENRELNLAPKFSVRNLLTEGYTEKIGKYYADQFPLRNSFISLKAYFELLLMKGENNGVVYAKNNTLIPREDFKENRLSDNLICINEFSKAVGSTVVIASLPTTEDVFSELLPKKYPKSNSNNLWLEYEKTVEELGLNSLSAYQALCEKNLYYRTDHHYTSEGAFLTYQLLGEKLGFTPKDKDFFKVETVTNEFCGTAMRTSGFYFVKKDKINLFRYSNDMGYNIVADDKEIKLYDFSKLEKTDKYAVFLGGNHRRVDIKNGSQNREKLLIIRDSFADSIAPFLALHYDLVLIDLRYYNDSVYEIVKNEQIDKVLILENISELATAKNISLLRKR